MKYILYRSYQFAARAAAYLLPWREPRLLEGEGSTMRLPGALVKDGVRRPLMVTGPTLRRLGAPDALLSALKQEGISAVVFSRVDNDPSVLNVEEAAACYHSHDCDGIIAFGGGSPMDCAKLCGARIARPKKTVGEMTGMFKVRRSLPPLYAVPTTAGTGSEATLAAVVTDDHHHKRMVGDLAMIPRVAVLDPLLTVGMPPRVTAASGMDALSHAVEAFIGHSNTPETRQNALAAVKLIFTDLERAYRNGNDREARFGMQQAAYRAGLAFTRANVGYVHAVAHALGGRYGIAHGACCAVAMPAVLRAYGPSAHRALAALSDAAGLTTGVASEQPDARKAERFIGAVEVLNRQLDLPAGFMQIRTEDVPTLATQAAAEGNLFYPAPKILGRAELEAIILGLAAEPAA